MTALRILAGIVLLAGLALVVTGLVWSAISASANMSFNNPLPRAGCALLAGGVALIAIAAFGVAA